MRVRRFGRAFAVAMSLLLVSASAVWADNTAADGDGVAPIAENNAIGFGEICLDQESTATVLLAAQRNGNYPNPQTWENGAVITFAVTGTTGTGLAASVPAAPGNQVTLPSDWSTRANNFRQGTVTATAALTPTALGAFAGTISFRGSGEGSADGVQVVDRDRTINVSATVVACAPADTTPPTVSFTTDPSDPDGASDWFVSPVTVTVGAQDTGSNVTSIDCTVDDGMGADAVSLANTSGIGTSMTASGDIELNDDGEFTISCTATDTAGNTSDPETLDVKIDQTDPTITLTTPADNATYLVGEVVIADYGCADATSGVASCLGDAADGDPIDTSATGSFSFKVDAEDNAGNTRSVTHAYKVVYDICVLYDQEKAVQANATLPIKLDLCDADGNNVSSPDVVVQAISLKRIDTDPSEVAVLEDAGNANPDNNFRYSADLDAGSGGYIFNLSTKNPSPALGITGKLAPGQYKLKFTVGGQSDSSYFVTFWVK